MEGTACSTPGQMCGAHFESPGSICNPDSGLWLDCVFAHQEGGQKLHCPPSVPDDAGACCVLDVGGVTTGLETCLYYVGPDGGSYEISGLISIGELTISMLDLDAGRIGLYECNLDTYSWQQQPWP
jgi:hypothetical protein